MNPLVFLSLLPVVQAGQGLWLFGKLPELLTHPFSPLALVGKRPE